MTGRQRPGVRWADARLVRVTARMQQGAAMDPRWPLPLDGLLASAARRRLLGELHGAVPDPHVTDLPLARYDRAGARWFWLASCAAPAPGSGEELHYWHRRFPHAAAERAAALPPVVYEGHGRYRGYRTPLPVTVTPVLEWAACGDPDGIASLLDGVLCTGKKRSQGEGMVLAWEVTDAGPADLDAVLRSRDGTISRPVPTRAAAALGLGGAETVPGAYRPPYWRPPQDNAAGPFARHWQEVIAPWTTLPSQPLSPPWSAAPARAS